MKPLQHLALFLTESCNLSCGYCFASNMERRPIDPDLARRAIDLLLDPASEARQVAISFWGGEPLLCFHELRDLVCYAQERARDQERTLRFSVPTNLTLLNEEMLEFCVEHRVGLSLSLDGDEAAQNLRTFAGGRPTFPTIQEKLELLRKRLGKKLPGVRMTVSPATAAEFFHHVRFFLDQGLSTVYFAPVVEDDWTAESLAAWEREQLRLADHWALLFEAGQVASFPTWDKALAYRELRRRGQLDSERRFLCGAGSTMLSVDINGELYPCHRFVFYDKQERAQSLGTVADGLPGEAARAAYLEVQSTALGTEATRCADCADAAQCYLFCPALNYSMTGDVLKIDERLCELARMERRVLDHLEERLGDHPRFRSYMTDHVLRVHAPGALSASVAAMFASLDESDADRLADRAEEIMRRLRGRRRADAES
ncbi:MAG: radical SAM protein [bacterium]